jgi:hypothetical protein
MGNIFFSIFLIIITMIACNSSVDKKPEQKSDNIVTTAKSNSVIVTDTISSQDMFALPADEIKDDSVFEDGSIPTAWASAGIESPLSFKKLLKYIKYWVANDQKDSVTNAIGFPLHDPKIKTKMLS